MSEKIVPFNEEVIKGELKELVKTVLKEPSTGFWNRRPGN
jgi:hypothetical protein